MNVGLFIPCYIDQFYPNAGIATFQLLKSLGASVSYPPDQTCCGQPMANAGFEKITGDCSRLFIKNFSRFEYVVAPSGSCVLHINKHLKNDNDPRAADMVAHKVFELTAFLTDILGIDKLNARFPHKVGVHQSCHGQRGLHLSQMSELVASDFSKPVALLAMVKDIQLTLLDRNDECCGFGGSFCITEEAVSVKMGSDRIRDHMRHGVEFITGVDMSCLMHLEGIIKRQKSEARVIHIAEILNSK